MAMTIVGPAAGITYRTRCLPQPQAERFAKCVAANPRFTDVSVEQSLRAKSDTCWFVQFKPVSEERQEAMFQAQQTSREERALSQGSGYVWVLDKDSGRPFFWLLSSSGETYEVDVQGRSCSCPDFTYRCQGNGIECKHIQALRNGLGTFSDFQPVPERGVPADAVAELDAHFDGLDTLDSWARCGKCGALTEPRELGHFRGYCANCQVGIEERCARIR